MIDRKISIAGQGGVGEILIGPERNIHADNVVGGLIGDDPIEGRRDARSLRTPGIGGTAVGPQDDQLDPRRDALPVSSIAAIEKWIAPKNARDTGAVAICIDRGRATGEEVPEDQILTRKRGVIRIGPGVDHHDRFTGPGNLWKVGRSLILMNQHRIEIPGVAAIHPTAFQSLQQRWGGTVTRLNLRRRLFNHGD